MSKLRAIAPYAVTLGLLWAGLGWLERLHRCIEAKGAALSCRDVGQAQTLLSLMVLLCAITTPLAYLYIRTYGDRPHE